MERATIPKTESLIRIAPIYLTNIATTTGAPTGSYTGIPFTYSPTATANDYREPALAVGSPGGTTNWHAGSPPAPWNTTACLVLLPCP